VSPQVRHHAVQVPATTANLGPGFDAFGLAVDRYLAVRSVDRGDQRERVLSLSDADVPDGDDNLVWRSLVAFCDEHDQPVPDVALRATTEIPLERGLGSSSAAIVAGLVLGRALTGAGVGDRDLVRLADRLEGHPDNVAPALLGGLVACAPGTDGLVVRRVNPAPALRPVLVVPAARQATTSARAVVPDSLPRDAVVAQAARAGHVLAALVGIWPVAVEASADLLHEPARATAMGASSALLDELRGAGIHAWLSGAGPSVAAAVPAAWSGELDVVRSIGDEHGFAVVPARFELSGAVACPDEGCAIAGSGGCVQCPRRRV
jgi:homoserine kinase